LKPGKNHSGITRWVIAACIIATEIVFLYNFAAAGTEYILSSLAVTLALLVQLRFGIREYSATPADIVVFIFNWLFLDLAPKIQLLSVPNALVNTSTVMPEQVLIANLLCALFIVTYTVVYASRSRPPQTRSGSSVVQSNAAVAMQSEFTAFGVFLALLVCTLAVAALGRTAYSTDMTVMTPQVMVIKKFLLFLPSATLLIFIYEMNRSRQKWQFSSLCVLILLIALVAMTENPLTEKRNGLGPIYLGLIFMVFDSKLRSVNRRLWLLVASMMLIFPAVTVLTHSHGEFLYGVKVNEFVATLKDHYFSVNYDAWANIYTVVEMVKTQGLQWGRQLLGDFLFFMPSSLWHGKPLATGIAIGNYLINHHSGWFTNLSAPLVGEGYFDFGVVGVVLYAAALAWIVSWLNRLARESGKWVSYPLAVYLSLFLMFAIRGSLMIAFAYGTGALAAFKVAAALLASGQRRIGQRYFHTDAESLFPGQQADAKG
jgi:hypothetical protein